MKRKPVEIIIPDTGPLITLAAADRLDLLQTFGRQVLVTDVVQRECVRIPGRPGEPELREWLSAKGANQFRTIETPFADVYDRLSQQPDPEPHQRATKGLGEASIAWTIANIERFASSEATTLVLIEDARAGDSMPRDVHVLSTRAWLNTLQNMGVIADAGAIMRSPGRTTSPYQRDQPATLVPAARSEWTSNTKAQQETPHKEATMMRDNGLGVGRLRSRTSQPNRETGRQGKGPDRKDDGGQEP